MTSFVVVVLIALSGCALYSCTMQEAKSVADIALSAADVTCIMTSELTDSKALEAACKIDASLDPLLRQLVATRDGAKKAGVHWAGDGGPLTQLSTGELIEFARAKDMELLCAAHGLAPAFLQ